MRRALERGFDVAGFAGQVSMLTYELKTRGQVVKFRATTLLRGCERYRN
jgi:hypothetical protein